MTNGSKINWDEFDEEWWIEYLEGETDAQTTMDMNMLIASSRKHQNYLGTWIKIREFMQNDCQVLDEDWIKQKCQGIEEKVMETIGQIECHQQPRPWSKA